MAKDIEKSAPDELAKQVDNDRRRLLKLVLVSTAYSVPLMASFSMDGLKLGTKAAQAGHLSFGSNLTFGSNQLSGFLFALKNLIKSFLGLSPP